jgi:hypothetical protein
MSPSALLLALGSLAGVLCGRALDGLGLLPGVHESAQVRAIALSPSWTLAGVTACLLLGPAVARTLRRSRPAGVLLLLGGQLLVLSAPEIAGRTGHHEGGEAPLFVAIGVQLALSVLTVTTALVVRRLLAPAQLAPAAPAPPARAGLALVRPATARQLDGGVRGRGPPRARHRLDPHPTHS